MGTDNRRRRAAKQRKRAARQRDRQVRSEPGPTRAGRVQSGRPESRERRADDPPRSDPGTLFARAVYAHHAGSRHEAEALLDQLASRPRAGVEPEVERMLARQLDDLWPRGWEPAMVDRIVERRLDDHEQVLARALVAAGARVHDDLGRRVAPEWMRQVDELDAARTWHLDEPVLPQLAPEWTELLRAAVRLMGLLMVLPDEPVLAPPPNEWREGMLTTRSNLPPGLLEKVRGLLAKAESTTFDAEAEAFTAKAQELMTRHRIDRMVLESAARDDERPAGRRVFIDDPYAEAKAVLLAAISRANGGHTVWSKECGWSTVFAFADELDIIEDLFTSLLVQATAALRREGSKHDALGRSRTTRFRRSFLVAFAHRIGQRLQEAVDATVADAEAETGRSLVPVLANRADAARDVAEEAFPDLRAFRPSATDGEGWHAGTMFGDRADLGVGAPVERRAAS